MIEHSEQAKAAYPDDITVRNEPGNTSSSAFNDRERTAFDRGYESGMEAGDYHEGFEEGHKAALAERRITDRETLAAAMREHHLDSKWVTPDYPKGNAGCVCGGWQEGDDEDWDDHLADAILALPSTPITSTYNDIALYHVIEKVIVDQFKVSATGLSDAVQDAVEAHLGLLASGLVKDNGATDSYECPEHPGCDEDDECCCYESHVFKTAPVDRLAVIREVIEWFDRFSGATKRHVDNARQHFGVAPVEEEA